MVSEKISFVVVGGWVKVLGSSSSTAGCGRVYKLCSTFLAQMAAQLLGKDRGTQAMVHTYTHRETDTYRHTHINTCHRPAHTPETHVT